MLSTVRKLSQPDEGSRSSRTRDRNPYTITEEYLIRKQQQGNRGRFVTQLYAGIVASIGALCLGLVIGWSTPVIFDRLAGDMPWLEAYIRENHYSWICSIVALGCAIGTIPSYLLLEKNVGPRRYMLVADGVVILMWFILAFLTSYNAFMVSRLIAGGAGISLFCCGQIFLKDCITRYYLRYMTMTFRSCLPVGIVIIFILAGVLSRKLLCLVCGSISLLHMIMLYFAHDSPVILYHIDPVRGEKALAWYWGPTNIQLQMRIMKIDRETRSLAASDPNTKYMLMSKVVVKGALMVVGLTFFQVFTGYYALLFYNLYIFKPVSRKKDVPVRYALIFAIFVGVFSCVGNFLHYKVPFGVKKPLIISSTLITLTFSVLCLYIAIGQPSSSKNPYLGPLVFFTIFVFSYEVGISFYPDVLLLDCMPVQVYGKVRHIIDCIHWLMVFIMAEYFLEIIRYTGILCLFLILALISFISVLYCKFFVIETSGKSLHDIQFELGGNPVGTRGYRAKRGLITVV